MFNSPLLLVPDTPTPFKLIPMLAKKNPLKYSFLPRTISLWNQLPQNLVNSNSLTSFKNKLDDYMIEL